MKAIRYFLQALIVAAFVVMMLPVLYPRPIVRAHSLSEASVWYTDFGLLLAGLIFLSYGILGRFGKVLSPDQRGYRLNASSLILLLAFPIYLLYIGNEVELGSGDTFGSRSLGPAILKKQTLDLSVFPAFRKKPLHYSAIRVKGRALSCFPIGTSLLALPYTFAGLMASDGKVTRERLQVWEKHFAALVSVASVCLLFLGIRRRFGEYAAIGGALVFALCTTLFTVASQAMWSFTGEIFFICLALYLLLGEPTAGALRPLLAGVAMSGAFLCRPTAALITIVLCVLLWFRNKRTAWIFALATGGSTGVIMFFLYSIYGHPLGGYGIVNQATRWWGVPTAEALAGNLISPSRGILLYFPYLPALRLILPALYKQQDSRRWSLASFAIVAMIYGLVSLYTKWWGGHSIGPRLMTETAPFLALLTVPLWISWPRFSWKRKIVLGCLIFSALTQFLGAYKYNAREWSSLVAVDDNPGILWSWKNSQLAATWIPGWEYSEQRRPPSPKSRQPDGSPGPRS